MYTWCCNLDLDMTNFIELKMKQEAKNKLLWLVQNYLFW